MGTEVKYYCDRPDHVVWKNMEDFGLKRVLGLWTRKVVALNSTYWAILVEAKKTVVLRVDVACRDLLQEVSKGTNISKWLITRMAL